jgi:hypothetical protein
MNARLGSRSRIEGCRSPRAARSAPAKVIAVAGLVAAALLMVSGCGGGGRPACGPPLNGSCLQGNGFYCNEYAGVPDVALTPIIEACTRADAGPEDNDEKGTWSAGGCPHARAVGGCREEQSGTCVAVWLYVGDVASARSMCSSLGGTWVNP